MSQVPSRLKCMIPDFDPSSDISLEWVGGWVWGYTEKSACDTITLVPAWKRISRRVWGATKSEQLLSYSDCLRLLCHSKGQPSQIPSAPPIPSPEHTKHSKYYSVLPCPDRCQASLNKTFSSVVLSFLKSAGSAKQLKLTTYSVMDNINTLNGSIGKNLEVRSHTDMFCL